MLHYEHRFTVAAPQAEVAAFHASANGLKGITPPVVIMRFHEPPPDPLSEGDHLRFTLWLGPIPVRWDSVISEMSDAGFTDTIGAFGPFAHWHHRHNFIAIDDHTTEVYDVIEAKLHANPLLALVGLLAWFGNPVQFPYRGWRTRALLEGK